MNAIAPPRLAVVDTDAPGLDSPCVNALTPPPLVVVDALADSSRMITPMSSLLAVDAFASTHHA